MSFSNQQDYINQFNDNAQKMFEPWTKLNKAFLKNAEQMTEFSLNTMRSYSEIGLDNLRQVAEIDSPESAKEFSSKQAEMLNGISQQMLADAQRLTELGKSMQEEVVKVMTEVYGDTNEKMQANMQKTAEQAAKTAKEFTKNMSKMAEKATDQVKDAVNKTTETANSATANSATTNSATANTASAGKTNTSTTVPTTAAAAMTAAASQTSTPKAATTKPKV